MKSKKQTTSVSIGIMAYNEEQNIAQLLKDILSQQANNFEIIEIIVVSSGSTDKTNLIVKKFHLKYSKIKLIIQNRRYGKSAAVNLFLKHARGEVIILLSADILLAPKSLQSLLTPFGSKLVGIVGSHPIPLNNPSTLLGFSAHFLWELHHQISLQKPKMGEMIAFRKIFKQIPMLSAVDEASIEPLIRGQGYKAVYAPNAIVYNKGPEDFTEFITVRRRIYAGHLATKYEYSYEVSTMSVLRISLIIFRSIRLEPNYIFFTPLVILLEAYARILGFLDYKYKLQNHTVWKTASTTKNLNLQHD